MKEKSGKAKKRPGISRFHLLTFFMCIFLAAGLSGCGEDKDHSSGETASAGTYQIYYTTADGDKLIHSSYKPTSENFKGILAEVLDQFRRSPKDGFLSTVPEEVKINSSTIGISEIDVDFSSDYLSLGKVQELLLRAALVETLGQLPGVDKVRITVEGQSLVLNGKEIEPMTMDSFILPVKDAINSYRTLEIPLYFSNQTGDKLVKEYRKIYYSSNINTERIVAEQIVSGPKNDSLLPVTGSSVIILGARVKGDTCLIDFSKAVNDLPSTDSPVGPETTLYAFVNAICEACKPDGVTEVRFTIEGSSDERFRGQVSLDQTFTPQKDMVEQISAGSKEAGVLVDAWEMEEKDKSDQTEE